VFLMGNQTLTLGAPAGQTLSVNDAITDQGGNGGSGGIVVNSAGTVDVETSVSIAGGVTLDQGQLTLGDNAAVFAQGYTFAGAATLDVRETIPHLLDGGPAELAGTPLVGNIADFGLGDTLVLRGVAAAAGGTDAITYDFVAGTQSVTETLPLSIKQGVLLVEPTLVQPDAEVPDTLDFTFTAIPSGLACFAAGTRIATLAGELAVEALAAGDRVVLAGGGTRPVRWVGRRQIDLRRHPRPHEVRPLRVCAGAIADGVPARELLLSPDHALFLDGALVTVRLLRNDASICTDDALDTVTYFHVELDAHDILLADGLAAESYLDTGNRDAFENGAATVALHPVFQGQHGREARSCAKLLTDPARLEAVWRRLAARATTLRPAVPRRESTDDPDLCVRVDGRQLRPVSRHAGRFVFALPAAPAGARLTSRSALPCDTSPWLDDRRRLGVFVRRLVVHEGGQPRAISLDDPGLRAGWWQPEASGRWTNGDAALPSWREPAVLHVDVGSTLAYKLPASAGRVITRNGCTGNG
jgi:hypothetical protein